jgi:hypothetical protein
VPFPASGRVVGQIVVLHPISWLFMTTIVALFALCVLTAAFARYAGRGRFQPERLLDQALAAGEGERVEFKEAILWGDEAENAVVRTVAAFLNKRGGTLLIGVDDHKKVVGLDPDYQSLGKHAREHRTPDKDRDVFQRHLRQVLSARLGADVSNSYVREAIVGRDNKDVCVLHAMPANSPVFLQVSLPDRKVRAL